MSADPTTDQHVRFGAGLRHEVSDEVASIGGRRVLVLTTRAQCELGLEVAEALGPLAGGVFARAAMHTPVAITEEALAHLGEAGADCVVSAGGGSTVGLGKALVLRRPELRHLALPTTYAGSECTPILGQTENGEKTTMREARLRPDAVLYDPELVATLPADLTVTSGLNAMAHAVEALYAPDRTPATDALAIQGLEAFATGLPQVVEAPRDLGAREATQRGAWACGTVLGATQMSLHHKLCHALGGGFDLPHAQTHAIVLPHATAFNEAAAGAALEPLARMLGAAPGLGLWQLARRLGAPTALRDLGLAEADLDRAADLATRTPYANPRDVTRDEVRALLHRAWSGEAPRT